MEKMCRITVKIQDKFYTYHENLSNFDETKLPELLRKFVKDSTAENEYFKLEIKNKIDKNDEP